MFERKPEAKLEFPKGWWGSNQKILHRGSISIFWNNTISTGFMLCFKPLKNILLSLTGESGHLRLSTIPHKVFIDQNIYQTSLAPNFEF